MKRFLLILLLCGVTYAPQKPKPMLGELIDHSHPLAHGLVGCWLMNEGAGGTVYDVSGNGNHGTLKNGAAWSSGLYGPAVEFDGSDAYIDCGVCPERLKFTSSDFTIVAWVKPDSDQAAVICGNDINTGNGGWSFWIYTSGSLLVFMQGSNQTSDTGVWTAGAWNQVVISFVNGTKKGNWYVNGISAGGEDTFAYAPEYTAGRHFVIGVDPRDNTGTDLDGQLDHVTVYSRILSPAEIASLYTDSFQMFESTPAWAHYSSGEAPSGAAQFIVITSRLGPLPIILLMTAALTFGKARKRGATHGGNTGTSGRAGRR